MSDGPLERGWLSDLIMHKLSKAKAHPWGLAVHREVLPVVEWRDEWQTCGWEAWQQTLCSRSSPGTSCVLLGAGSAYSDSEKKKSCLLPLYLWIKDPIKDAFDFLASTTISKERKCIEAFKSSALDWLFDARTLEGTEGRHWPLGQHGFRPHFLSVYTCSYSNLYARKFLSFRFILDLDM